MVNERQDGTIFMYEKQVNFVNLKEIDGFECLEQNRQMFVVNENRNIAEWTQKEIMDLFSFYDVFQSKWFMIQQFIPKKNKIQIRNKFYGSIRKVIRSALQFFGVPVRSLSSLSNKIKPSVLQKIYHSKQDFDFLNGAVRNVMKQMCYKNIEQRLLIEFVEKLRIYRRVIWMIIPQGLKNKNKVRKCMGVVLENQAEGVAGKNERDLGWGEVDKEWSIKDNFGGQGQVMELYYFYCFCFNGVFMEGQKIIGNDVLSLFNF